MGIRQVDLESAAPFGHLGTDVHVLRAVAVVVEHCLAVVDPVLPAGDHRAYLALGAIQDGLDRGVRGRRAELLEQGRKAALADPRRADHGCEVAAKLPRMPHVQHDQIEHVLAQPARLVQPKRRNPDALLPDLGGARVVGAVRGAADVALMRAVDRPERQLLTIEHRHERSQIGQMVAAVIGIVEQEHVARPHVAAEVVVHRTGRPGQRADVDRHVLGLGDQPPLGVAQRGREIAAGVDDLRVRGAQHRLAHLLGDRMQPVADHRDRDRIDAVLRVLKQVDSLAQGRWNGRSIASCPGQGNQRLVGSSAGVSGLFHEPYCVHGQ